MARERRPFRLTPWAHAALVGAGAGAAVLAEQHVHVGGGWVAIALLVFSRVVGAGLAHAPKVGRRRETQAQVVEDLRRMMRQLISGTHQLSNEAAVVVGEMDELLERLDQG